MAERLLLNRDSAELAVVKFIATTTEILNQQIFWQKFGLATRFIDQTEADRLKSIVALEVTTNIEAIHETCQKWDIDITARVGSGRGARVSAIDVIVGFEADIGAYGASIMTSNGPGVLALDHTVVVEYR